LKVNIVSLVDPRRLGGLESYIRLLLNGLPSRGVEVALNGAFELEDSEIAVLWNGRVKRLLPLMTRRPFRKVAELVANHVGRSWAIRHVDDFDVHHFVGTGWNLAGFPMLSVAKGRGKPFTCWPAVHPGSWGDSPLDIDFYRGCDLVFCQSNYEADHLNRLGVPKSRLLVMPCGPEAVNAQGEITKQQCEAFRRKHSFGERLVILFIGRKSQDKGYHRLREAVKILLNDGVDLVLVAIGKDVEPPYPDLPPSSVCDLGVVDEDTKRIALSTCDIFALPSRAESFGIVYTEAWSYGKPVLCGLAPASQELVAKHDGGLITDGSPSDIAGKLWTLISDHGRRKSLGGNGLDAVRRYYSATAVTQSHLNAWEDINRN
jgi:glycosyltransferase involved in cell wall biosynthesis